jgi:hypothetical protein
MKFRKEYTFGHVTNKSELCSQRIERTLSSPNAQYRSVKNILSFYLLSKYITHSLTHGLSKYIEI